MIEIDIELQIIYWILMSSKFQTLVLYLMQMIASVSVLVVAPRIGKHLRVALGLQFLCKNKRIYYLDHKGIV